MPMRRERYPDNWPDISRRIRARAHNRCEFCEARNGFPHPDTGSKVVLTVAHLGVPYPDGRPGNKHDKMDCRDENLAALYQRCHLNYDRDEHKFNAAVTRHRKKVLSGQIELIPWEVAQ